MRGGKRGSLRAVGGNSLAAVRYRAWLLGTSTEPLVPEMGQPRAITGISASQ
jgi:hypothetical protein